MPYTIPLVVCGIKEGITNHLTNALNTWYEYFGKIWNLLTTSPQSFMSGHSGMWYWVNKIYTAFQGIGIGLLTLFFVYGLVHTLSSYVELKRPEVAVKIFVRLALAKLAITNGMEFILNIINFTQALIIGSDGVSGILTSKLHEMGFRTFAKFQADGATLPEKVSKAINDLTFSDFWGEIGMWLVTLIGSLVVVILSFVMLMSVYGRFFKLYMYVTVSPLMLSTFGAESTQNVGKGFVKNFIAVCLEGVIIAIACLLFLVYLDTNPFSFTADADGATIIWDYILQLVMNLLVLTGLVKSSDRVVKELMGLG